MTAVSAASPLSLPTRIARAQALLDWMNRHAR
jgi:hypothetical protein